MVAQGLSGLAALMARDRGDAPEQVRPAYVDAATGIIGALGVVAALRHRDRTGEGQKVETSLLSSALSMGANILNWFAASDAALWEDLDHQLTELREQGSGFGEQRDAYYRSEQPAGIVNIYFRYYRTEDGFISVGALSPKLNQRLGGHRRRRSACGPRVRRGHGRRLGRAHGDGGERRARLSRETQRPMD